MHTYVVKQRWFRKIFRLCKNSPQLSLCRTFMSGSVARRKKLWKVLFYGTDELSCTCLKALNLNRCADENERLVDSLDAVCLEVDSPVRKYCKSAGLTIYNWPYDVPENQYDIGIISSFGRLIPSKDILACKYGMINSHPSLLPRWRGSSPIIYAVLHGDTETGVTILQVSPKKFDVGNILMQRKYPIPPHPTSQNLTAALSKVCAEMILETLKDLPYFIRSSHPQPNEGATYAKKVNPQMGFVDWTTSSTLDIDRKFRAFHGFVKLFTYWKDMKVTLLNFEEPEVTLGANVDDLTKNCPVPGFCYYHKRRKVLYVRCTDGWVGITEVLVSGRKAITARDFYNGFMTKVKLEECYFQALDLHM